MLATAADQGVPVDIAVLPQGTYGEFTHARLTDFGPVRHIFIDPTNLAERRAAAAAILAHELTHLTDDLTSNLDESAACYLTEAHAYRVQAQVWTVLLGADAGAADTPFDNRMNQVVARATADPAIFEQWTHDRETRCASIGGSS